jgi:hypothetical protein
LTVEVGPAEKETLLWANLTNLESKSFLNFFENILFDIFENYPYNDDEFV